jgi:hypothetical protein
MENTIDVERAKELLEVITALAQGKEIQYSFKTNPTVWFESTKVGFNDKSLIYRIKPEPKFRPWTFDEVPVGAIVRLKDDKNFKSMIISVSILDNTCVALISEHGHFNSKRLSESFEYQENNTTGKFNWLPCGIQK